jgi:hypothetical protein
MRQLISRWARRQGQPAPVPIAQNARPRTRTTSTELVSSKCRYAPILLPRCRVALSGQMAINGQRRMAAGGRVSSEPFLTVPDSPGQARYRGFQLLTVSDRTGLSRQ